jgi:hypothetical protein
VNALALLYQVPILVFKYCSSFQHYVVVDVAIYGPGSPNTKMLSLIQTNKDMFDYLKLNASADAKARAIYSRVYKRQFREEHLRDAPVSDEGDNQSLHSLVDDDDDVSSESSIPPLKPDAEESDAESSDMSDDQHSKAERHSCDLSSADTSFTSSESQKARKRDGHTFDPLCQAEKCREARYGMYSVTNKVIDAAGNTYQSSQPVKVRKYPAGRFLYACSLWENGSVTPYHLLYDHFEGTIHHTAPSSVTALTADEIIKLEPKLPDEYLAIYENNLKLFLDDVSKRRNTKTKLRFPKLSGNMYPSLTSTSDGASTIAEEPPVARSIAGRRSAGKGR